MRHSVAVLLVAVGVGLVGWVALDDTGDDVGEVDVGDVDVVAAPTDAVTDDGDASASSPSSSTTDAEQSSAAAGSTGTDPGSAAGSDGEADRPQASEIARSSARVGDLDTTAPVPPRAIGMPSVGVEATVVPVGVDADGLMAVPEDVDEVGWYRFGVAPDGEAGTIVLAGHVDSRTQGRGAFFDLRALEVGDEVTLTDGDGTISTWRVTGRRSFAKESLPVSDLYRRDGPRRLVLITCGGDFDADVGSYRANVVVQAEPVA